MAEKLLTDLKARQAKPRPLEYLLSDGSGLFLRVRKAGKDWQFIYSLNGKRRKQGLGSYPDVSLDRARTKASESRREVAEGRDAIQSRVDALKDLRAKEAASAARYTVKILFEDWHRREASKHKDGGVEVRRAIEKDVLPIIGDRYADDVTRRDVMRVLDTVKERKVVRYVNVLLQYLRQMFRFAITREIVKADPTFGILKKEAGGKDSERDRILTKDEIGMLSKSMEASGLAPAAQEGFWLMLATACRVGELSKSRWEDIDLKKAIWVIPEGNAKNKRAHTVHLSDFSVKRFTALQTIAHSETWVYPNRDGDLHICPKALQKQFRDRQRTKALGHRSKKVGALSLKSGEWTAHDLRRTAATFMGELGVRSDVIDRGLNHLENRKVTRIYQRQELLSERAEAFHKLGQLLERLRAD